MANGELPFVSSSAICENPYRLCVSVSSREETDLARLLAFDTVGGAIEIVFSETPPAAE